MCGIVCYMVSQESEINVAPCISTALTMLQHRGQDACGITTCDREKITTIKNKGLVSAVFTEEKVSQLNGFYGIGHCNYPTSLSSGRIAAQPFYSNYPYGIALGMNGNITNSGEIKKDLLKHLRCINTNSNAELMVNYFAKELELHISKSHVNEEGTPIPTAEEIFQSIHNMMKVMKGAYSVVIVIKGIGIIAFRDPFGIRPLCFGCKRDANNRIEEFMAASESVALEASGIERERDIEAAEVIFVDMQMNLHTFLDTTLVGTPSPCIFEYVYIARPDSVIDNISVYEARTQMGVRLADRIRKIRVIKDGKCMKCVEEDEAGYDETLPSLSSMVDIVMSVPDTSRHTAIATATNLNKRYIEGLSKNRYVARTFIIPGQAMREKSIRIKHNPIHDAVKGLSVLLVDDSIVRGTTCKQIVDACRRAGATHVFVATACPAVIHPNIYGIDTPTKDELVAYHSSKEEVASYIHADYVIFQRLDDLKRACSDAAIYGPAPKNYDCSCFDGVYVAGIPEGMKL